MRHSRKGCDCSKCEARRAYERARRNDPEIRRKANAATRRWANSDEGRAYHKAYKATDAYKATQASYQSTEPAKAAASAAKRRYRQTEKGRAAERAADARRRARDPIKISARKAVNKAKRRGKITPSPACESCGSVASLEGHHWNGYDRANRLNVRWLCVPCHKQEHERESA